MLHYGGDDKHGRLFSSITEVQGDLWYNSITEFAEKNLNTIFFTESSRFACEAMNTVLS